MRRGCVEAGVPEPQFEEYQGFRVVFRKDLHTEEYLRKLGLNERQIKAVGYVREKGKIPNKEYREIFGIAARTAREDIFDLCVKNIFQDAGKKGKNTEYIFNLEKPEINPKYPSNTCIIPALPASFRHYSGIIPALPGRKSNDNGEAASTKCGGYAWKPEFPSRNLKRSKAFALLSEKTFTPKNI